MLPASQASMYSTMSANPLQKQTSRIVATACDHSSPVRVSAYDIQPTYISLMMLAIQFGASCTECPIPVLSFCTQGVHQLICIQEWPTWHAQDTCTKCLQSVCANIVHQHIVINAMPPRLQSLIKLGSVLTTDNKKSQGVKVYLLHCAYVGAYIAHTWSTMISIEDKDPILRPRFDNFATCAYDSRFLPRKHRQEVFCSHVWPSVILRVRLHSARKSANALIMLLYHQWHSVTTEANHSKYVCCKKQVQLHGLQETTKCKYAY